MMHWTSVSGLRVDCPKVDEFIGALEKVCRTYGLSISHEDTQGAFIIDLFDQSNIHWLQVAGITPAVEELYKHKDKP